VEKTRSSEVWKWRCANASTGTNTSINSAPCTFLKYYIETLLSKIEENKKITKNGK
jgi:hypothetical protein